MAVKLKPEDLNRSGNSTQSSSSASSSEEGFDINKFLIGLNQFISNVGNSASQIGKSFEQAKVLKEKITGQKEKQAGGFQPPTMGGNAIKEAEFVEKAERPQDKKKEESTGETMTDKEKVEKAEQIFKELHGLIKPYLLIARTLTLSTVIQMAMQPKNKAMIVNEIAKRL